MNVISIHRQDGSRYQLNASRICGHLAIHRTYCGEGWQLTHIPTGRALGRRFPSFQKAVEFARRAREIVDFNFKEPSDDGYQIFLNHANRLAKIAVQLGADVDVARVRQIVSQSRKTKTFPNL